MGEESPVRLGDSYFIAYVYLSEEAFHPGILYPSVLCGRNPVRDDVYRVQLIYLPYEFLSSRNESACFKMLTSVSGVGPKAALSILSELTPEQVAAMPVQPTHTVNSLDEWTVE